MKVLEFKDGNLKERSGLSKVNLDVVNKQIKLRSDFDNSIKHFTIDKNLIEEGVFKIDKNGIYYKCGAKKVKIPRLDVTIRPNKNIEEEFIKIEYYDFWYPDTYWLINFYREIRLISNGDMLPAPILNLWERQSYIADYRNSYRVCTGRALEGISYTKKEDILIYAGVLVNSILSGKMNLDLYWGDETRENYDSMVAGNVHKLFLQVSFIHSKNIKTAQEANEWWKKFYKNKYFFKDLVFDHEMYDEELLKRYEL